MRLWIDGQCLQTTSRLRGIGRYMSELLRAIAQTRPDVELSISFNAAMSDAAIAARSAVAPWIAPANIHVWQGAAPIAEYLSGYTRARRLGEIALAHHIACLAPDMALSASPFEGQGDPSSPFLDAAGHDIPRAAIFYDAIPYRYPERYLRNRGIAASYKRRLAAHRNFNHLLAISDFARREAMALLPHAEVVRIDAAVSPDFLTLAGRPIDPDVAHRLGIRAPFMLYVGALDWRKNVIAAAEAFALLPAGLRDDLQFVLAGKAEPSDLRKLRAVWQQGGLRDDRLIMLDHVTDAVLVQLYKQASLVIQPSLIEGFGLTALEAMQCGVPVIASNTGALPEVIGDARALFDPTAPAQIAARITEILSNPALAQSLVEQGVARAGEFSWARTARLAVEALSGWARSDTSAPDRDAVRRVTRAALGRRPRNPEAVAEILSACEPRPPHSPRLLIEATATSYNDPGTGIQRVVKNIAGALLERPDVQSRLFWCHNPRGFFEVKIGPGGALLRTPAEPAHHILPGVGDHILMLDSSWGTPEAYNQMMRRARLQGSAITSVLYDLVPLKMPAFCDVRMSETFTAWIKSALLYSTGFVCISRAVADEFLALLEGIDYPRTMQVGYWRMGADLQGATPIAPAAAPHAGDAPMFLMVGTLEPRKGHRVALEAFSTLWRSGFAGRLVIIGKQGWATDRLAADLRAHPEWGKKLIWLENAGDEVLEAHYAACTTLVAASLAEGFGLPIVEAVRHGKPVIASDIAIFREVAGEFAGVTYFRAGSAGALAAAVEDFLARHDQAPLTRQDTPTTWAESAAELVGVLEQGHWYRTYRPRHPASDIVLNDVGDWRAQPLRTEKERRHLLELVEGPIPISRAGNRGTVCKFIVRLTNLSDAVWSSAGENGVALAIRPERSGGKAQLSRIPLIQLPGEAHYMAVELDTKEIGTARRAAIGLMQGSGDWWLSPLMVTLT